ncbi:uncharacterized protein PFL1_03067 [Pseudozyma flocculosa PF-1]|uniref:Related to ankyrin n=2 Tax=Pseudozyma flocculosa TaxID=84751 RepID=A0A5C3F1S5_9BASI|nr:uncharacterized protein PFL1_03067 [Pseudozyma flocculosa PF-1]EPQ29312.1 hypothetical protein PFL1_03067 [Pseudozyma flocculosa PF-1]SPO37826.1 related to ankyrin [Pseudozyma flocculosa]
MSPVPTSTDIDPAYDPMRPPQGVPSGGGQAPRSVSELPNAAIDLANRMFDLARQGNLDLIQYLEAGLPANLTNNRGDTLLMLASYHGHAELVRRMLEVGSDDQPPAPAPNNATAAQLPRRRRAKPDPNQLNGRGQSIVAGAVFKGYDEVVRILVQHGADPAAGQPSAEETAKMFGRWDGEGGHKQLFEDAPGRGAGAREASEAVEDREEARRVPGVGLQTSAGSGP